MTEDRARHLVFEHGCRLETGHPQCLAVVNEAINFKFILNLSDLPGIGEEAFISTITTGLPPHGQQSLPGIYRDFQYPGWSQSLWSPGRSIEPLREGLAQRASSIEQCELASLEYESLQAEKRDRLNSRVQHWSLFFALVSGFGLVSVQSGAISYLVALYPLLAMCLARYVAHSERVLDQVKNYLLTIEQNHNYTGYEQYNKLHKKQRAAGSQIKALRDAILATQTLATGMIAIRLLENIPLAAGVIVAELMVLLLTWRLFSEKKGHKHTGAHVSR